jgi:hypothetical protein
MFYFCCLNTPFMRLKSVKNIALYSIFILGFTSLAYADAKKWEVKLGGRYDDKVNYAVQTSDGGYIFAGYTESKGKGGKDAWLVKISQTGQVVFDKTFGEQKDDIFHGIAEDPAGGFVAVGRKQNPLTGYVDAWIVGISDKGEELWSRTYSGSEFACAYRVRYIFSDKSFVVLASRDEKGDHDMNIWMMKINRRGQMLSQGISRKRFLNDEGVSMAPAPDDATVVAGYVEDKYNLKNLYIVKFDKRGNEVWAHEYGGAKNDYATGVTALSGERFFVSGVAYSKGSGDADGWGILVDRNGRLLAENTFGGSSADYANSLAEAGGGYILAGKTKSLGPGGYSNWIVKLCPEIKMEWQHCYGDKANQEIACIVRPESTDDLVVFSNWADEITGHCSVVATKWGPGIKEAAQNTPAAPALAQESANISIISPMVRRGFKTLVSESTVEIKGRVSSDAGLASVYVNGKAAMLQPNGEFMVQSALNIGTNSIRVEAKETNGKLHVREFSIDRAADAKSDEDFDFRAIAGRYYALLIGVESYMDDAINNLDRPIADAQMLYNTLTTHYTFDKENVLILKNPTRAEIIIALDNLSSKITQNDNLLIFFAGHGYWDQERRQGYWLPADAQKANTANWLRNSTIRDYVSSMPSKHTLLIADACFSGGIFRTRSAFTSSDKAISSIYALPSRKAMTSGTLVEVPDQSVFIEFFNKRLIDNSKEYIASEELFTQFRTAVINNSPTVPLYGTIQDTGDEGGEFIFIKRR